MITAPRLLLVCTGNVCRSPLAELLLRRSLGATVDLASAGTAGVAGVPITEGSLDIARSLGVTVTEPPLSRGLDVEAVRGAGLILGAAREHRAAVARMLPRASRHTFTIREFARIIDGGIPEENMPTAAQPAARLESLTVEAAKFRGYLPVLDPSDDDILDPVGGDKALYQQMADQLVPAIETILDALGAGFPWQAWGSGADDDADGSAEASDRG